MVQLLEQNGANLFMKDGEGYSGLQLATNLVQNEIVAYLQPAFVKRKSDLMLKWNNVFQDKPILMLDGLTDDEKSAVRIQSLRKYLLPILNLGS